ncbi:unnamed protein product [Rotaria sp. Silwood1]|nr:unnamed protein product [Rotaria sp. Silwood1]
MSFRIRKIKKDPPISTDSNTSTDASTDTSTDTSINTNKGTDTSTTSSKEIYYPKITISQEDMFHIFDYLTILFIGDNSIRTIYRDFVQIFSTGRLLKKGDATIQHGEYKMEGEVRLQKGGKRGHRDYKDVRYYFCQTSSTQLIYIYIPTVFGDIAQRNIDYLKTIKNCRFIHAVIFSLYHGDLNFAQLKKIEIPFNQHLEQYDENFNKICMHLLDICENKKDRHQKKIWMGPFPPNMKLTKEQKEQFKEIILHTDTITKINGFKRFKRNFIWKKTHKELLIKNTHYFSPKGIRLMTQFLAEIIGTRWERTI